MHIIIDTCELTKIEDQNISLKFLLARNTIPEGYA